MLSVKDVGLLRSAQIVQIWFPFRLQIAALVKVFSGIHGALRLGCDCCGRESRRFSSNVLDILIAFACKRHVTQVDLAVSHHVDHVDCFTKFIMMHQFLISVDFCVGSS